MLAPPGLPLGELAGDARGFEPPPDLADEVLVLGRLQDVVVLEEGRVRRQALVALGVGLLVAVAEEVELDLRGQHRRVAERGCGLLLPAQDLAGRDLDRLAGVDVDQVAQHEGGPIDPARDADGRRVDDGPHVAVALLVAGEAVARDRVVVHVRGDQVVAGLVALGAGDVVEVEAPGGPLAHQPALQVRERRDDRVDLAGGDGVRELLRRDVHPVVPLGVDLAPLSHGAGW